MDAISEIKEKSISYLAYRIGDETYATHVAHINNIVEVPRITKIPQAPKYMQGVINLRGEVLPVIDTRIRFGMSATEFTSKTCVLVVEVQIDKDIIKVGMLADEVREVMEIKDDEILPPPKAASVKSADFIYGIYRKNEELIMMLDMNLIFSLEELGDVQQQVESIAKEVE